MKSTLPGLCCGILGGGQLGRMMAIEARRLGIRTVILDAADQPPAAGLADLWIRGSLKNPQDIRKLANASDILTYEIEHINTSALHELEGQGAAIFPRPGLLDIIADKLEQKRFLASHGLPVPGFAALDAPEVPGYSPQTYPFIQKARGGGYDGRGVVRIDGPQDLGRMLPVDSMVEECVDIQVELSVLLARGQDGQVAVWDLVEMAFDPEAQICDMVCVPARVDARIAAEAQELGRRCVEVLDGVGVFGVELFLDTRGRLLVNEIAPRPHNSGHWTIEGAHCNQFEQHLRAVCGLPLGSPALRQPSVMYNLLGDPGAQGLPVLRGLREALAVPGFHFHWYQKAQVAPWRKMGHWTVTADSLDQALETAGRIHSLLGCGGA